MICVYLIIVLAVTKGTVSFQTYDPNHLENVFDTYVPVQPTLYSKRTKREISTTKDDDGGHLSSLTLRIPADGKELILDLELKEDLVLEDHTVQYQEGGRTVFYKSKKEELDLCHYFGSVRGKPNSWAAVSTCHGVSGVIFDGIKLWQIAATENEIGTQHFLYYSNHTKTESRGIKEDLNHSHVQPGPITRQIMSTKKSVTSRYKRNLDNQIQELRNAFKQQLYVELRMVADQDLYIKKGSVDAVQSYVIELLNIVNSMYSPLNISIVLVELIVWSEEDKINVNVEHMDETYIHFFEWIRLNYKYGQRNDHMQLLSGQLNKLYDTTITVGYTGVEAMCTRESLSVIQDYSSLVGRVAATMAHEIGHSLGMYHDSVAGCDCPVDQCIMAVNAKGQRWHWSSCSIVSLLNMNTDGRLDCLRNNPIRVFNTSICGNGLVEPDEQCDCGLDIGDGSNPCIACCDITTCRFKSMGTVCRDAASECDQQEQCSGASELCPDDVFKSTGTVCRNATSECDQPEYCSGTLKSCPDDVFKPAGTVCRNATSECDQPEQCSGASKFCPDDLFKSAGTVCRNATSECDQPEYCSGTLKSCPDDVFKPTGTVCRNATSECDQPEQCSGASKFCPDDLFKSAGTVCRNATSECDQPEYCLGTSKLCPDDLFKSADIVCRNVTSEYDLPEYCSGYSKNCPDDAFKVTPFTIPIPDGLYPGRIIQVQATTSTETQWFTINLQCGPSAIGYDDIAFHLSFRFNQNIVVRTHRQRSAKGARKWGSEEIEEGIPITKGELFEVMFLCEVNAFKVFINGTYFTEFKHRIPYHRITHLNFQQQITVKAVSFKDAAEVTPLTYPIPDGMYPGRAIRMQASTPAEAQWSTINLQCGPSRDDDVALHLSFRFDQATLVRNHLLNTANGSTWGGEEKGAIPISRGEPFEVLILCEENAFKIFINDVYFTEFKHHIPYRRITYLSFKKQITVRSVGFMDAAEVTPLTYPIPDGMYPGRTIRVQATTSAEAQWFSINLQCGPGNHSKDDIAFHLSFRFNNSIVARNHLLISPDGASTWGSEESEGGLPISRGDSFEVLFLCEENAFKVFINGTYFTEFKHRIPYHRITHLNFKEQITVQSITF